MVNKKLFLSAAVVSILVLFAVLDEIHQIKTPGRFFSVHDILTDSFASIAITSLFNL